MTISVSFASMENNPSFFLRCYGQLTGSRPVKTDPLIRAIIEGSIEPVSACHKLIDRLSVPNRKSKAHVNFLNTMARFHSNWFGANDMYKSDRIYPMNDLYNSQAMG